MRARIAINGLGRTGPATLKIVLDEPELELVAVNDIAPPENLAYLKYDTVYGRYVKSIEAADGRLVVDGKSYQILNQNDPAQLPWRDLGIDVVFECTGMFTKKEDLQQHIQAGARHAILLAPEKGRGVSTAVHGVNAADPNFEVISCASCTTTRSRPWSRSPLGRRRRVNLQGPGLGERS